MRDLSQLVYALGRSEPGGIQLLGTAFAVAPDKVATAQHVVGASDQNLVMVLPRIKTLREYQDTSDKSLRTVPLTIHAADPIRDLCVLQIPGEIISFSHTVGSSDDVEVGSPLATLGFPHANFGRMVLTQQQAHVGAKILLDNMGEKSKHIVLNTQARDGQSGGPVFDHSMQRVIAILLGSFAPDGGGGISLGGVDPHTLHQTTHAISAEYLRDML